MTDARFARANSRSNWLNGRVWASSMDVSINGLNIHYVDVGNRAGLPVTFVHAFPLSHAMWQPQIEALKDRHRVVAYDVRGFGDSEAGDGQYTLEFFVDDLIALLDHLKIGKTVVCGESMGGYIALRAVERRPGRFSGLVLCDTRSQPDSDEAKLKRAGGLKAVKSDGVATFAERFVNSVLAPHTLSAKPDVVEWIKKTIAANKPVGLCGALLAMASRTDTTPGLAKINVPTLVLVGEHDPLTPPEVGRGLHRNIPHATFHVIPNAGHLSNLENPREFNDRLVGFLSGLG